MNVLGTNHYIEQATHLLSDTNGLGYLLTDIGRLLRQRAQARLVGNDVTLVQAKVLVYVQRFEGVHQTDLAVMLEMQLGRLVKLVDQLINNNLIVRKPDPSDRRAYKLYISSAAAKYLNDLNVILNEVDDEALHGFTQGEINALTSALTKLRSNLAGQS